MKKVICLLLVAAAVVTFGACGDKKNDKKSEENKDVENDSTYEEIQFKQAEKESKYEGMTIKELEDEGFVIDVVMSVDSYLSITFINFNENLELEGQIKLSEEKSSELDALDEFENSADFIHENMGDEKVLNCIEQYRIYSVETLYQLVDKGLYEKSEELEGKSILALLDEGYEYESCHEDVKPETVGQYIITMFDTRNQEWRLVVDISGTELEELSTSTFWFDEESLENVMVKECYTLK